MSLKKQAARVRAKGKKNIGEDSLLAHINPREAAMLKAQGGSGRIDPDTGIPHFDEGDANGGGGGFGGFSSGGGWGAGTAGGNDATESDHGWASMSNDATNFGGYGAPNEGGLTDIFNPALDSQMANESLGLTANSDFTGTPSYDSTPTDDGWSLSKVMKSPITQALSALNPVTRAAMIGYNMINAKSPMDVASKALGAFGGPIGGMVSTGLNAATSSNPTASFGKAAGSSIGGLVGGALGGPLGASVGGLAGGYAAGAGMSGQGSPAAGNQGNQGSQPAQGGIDYSALASGLGGLYSNYKAGQQANDAAKSLQDLYSPNGAYAQQLRQTLERKDAAGGRRSQYGPRETQLTAMLADKYAGNVMNMNKLQQSGLRSNGQLMSTGLNLLNKTGALNKGASYLNNLFSGDATNGNGGYTSEGTTYNNPSAYTAPTSGESSSGGNFWDDWI